MGAPEPPTLPPTQPAAEAPDFPPAPQQPELGGQGDEAGNGAGISGDSQFLGPPALHKGSLGSGGMEWIMCDECNKWRQAATGTVARGPWECTMNKDPRCACCA